MAEAENVDLATVTGSGDGQQHTAGSEPAQEAPDMELIEVVSRDPTRVGAHEKHPMHPGGEALVVDKPVQVAPTPFMLRRLADGHLLQTGGSTRWQDDHDTSLRDQAVRLQNDRDRADRLRMAERLAEDAEDLKSSAVWSNAMAGKDPSQHQQDAQESRAKAEELLQQSRDLLLPVNPGDAPGAEGPVYAEPRAARGSKSKQGQEG